MAEWIYGRRAVLEMLKAGLPVKRVVITEDPQTHEIREIKMAAQSLHLRVENRTRHALNALVRGNHQGVAAQIEAIIPAPFKTFLLGLAIAPGTFVCLLDEIQDPQNLGAIIRNAVCFGCSGVILPNRRSAGLTPAVMKTSSGALAFCPVSEIANLGVAVERLKEKGFFVYGADAAQGSSALEELVVQYPAALVLGSEHEGIKPVLKKACDKLVRISQRSTIQSLNVASASAIFFHALSHPQKIR